MSENKIGSQGKPGLEREDVRGRKESEGQGRSGKLDQNQNRDISNRNRMDQTPVAKNFHQANDLEDSDEEKMGQQKDPSRKTA